MSVLSDLWGGGLAGSNSPNWLVSDDDLRPVLAHLSDGIELSIIDILGLSRLSFSEELTNASEDGETCINGKLGLLGNVFVGLSVEGSSLGVTSEGVLDSHILGHGNGEFSGVSTITCQRQVLESNTHVILQDGLNGGDVKGRWGDNDLNLLWVKLEFVKHVNWE
jgi:hypothetical protein